MHHKKPHAPGPDASSRKERFAGLVMSLAAVAGFGTAGVMSLWDHAITLPGRNGPVHNSGSPADMVGWLLLAAAAAFLAHFAILAKPGKVGAKWALAIVLVWGAAAVTYYATR